MLFCVWLWFCEYIFAVSVPWWFWFDFFSVHKHHIAYYFFKSRPRTHALTVGQNKLIVSWIIIYCNNADCTKLQMKQRMAPVADEMNEVIMVLVTISGSINDSCVFHFFSRPSPVFKLMLALQWWHDDAILGGT